MNDNAIKKNKLSIVGVLFGFVLLTTIMGMIVGYQLIMQTPDKLLGGSVSIQEAARINAEIYGIGGFFIGITGSIVYLYIELLQESRSKIKCPWCGATVPLSTDSFCRNCGSTLS